MGVPNFIDFKISENGCFECTSHATDGVHYPSIQRNKIKMDMHRFIYIECFGEIPKGLLIRHKCDNRKCINPEHLELGTHKDNLQDMVKRGRSRKGTRHHGTRFTEDDIKSIRKSSLKCTELANRYNVSFGTISKIRLRTTWKHIQEEE